MAAVSLDFEMLTYVTSENFQNLIRRREKAKFAYWAKVSTT